MALGILEFPWGVGLDETVDALEPLPTSWSWSRQSWRCASWAGLVVQWVGARSFSAHLLMTSAAWQTPRILGSAARLLGSLMR